MRQIIYSILLSLLLICILASYISTCQLINKDPVRTDFSKFYHSLKLYQAGESIYKSSTIRLLDKQSKPPQYKRYLLAGNLNPPFFILLIWPLSLFHYADALTLWLGLSFCAGMVSVIWLLHIFKIKPIYQPQGLILGCFILGYFPCFLNLQTGQVGLWMLLASIGLWHCYREGYHRGAGIILGIIMSIKIFFGLFLCLFLAQRRWQSLVWACLCYVLCFILAGNILGFENYLQYQHVLKNIYWYTSSWNGSLLGFLLRLFDTSEKNIPLIILPDLAKYLYYFCSALLLIFYLKMVSSASRQQTKMAFDLCFSCTLALMLFISPLGWAYYFPILLIPFLVIWFMPADNNHVIRLKFSTGMCLLLSGIPSLLLQPWQIVTPKIIFTQASFYCYALIILFGILCGLLKVIEIKSTKKLLANGQLSRWLSILWMIALSPSLLGILGLAVVQKLYQ